MKQLACVLAVALVAAGASTGATAATPTLRLLDTSPLVVRGSGFERHEIVRLVYRARSTIRRRVVANAIGRFTIRFPIAVWPCATYSLSAIGAMGSTTFLKLPPAMCPQPVDEP